MTMNPNRKRKKDLKTLYKQKSVVKVDLTKKQPLTHYPYIEEQERQWYHIDQRNLRSSMFKRYSPENEYEVTGTKNFWIPLAESEGEARRIFHDLFKGESIVSIRIADEMPF